MKTTKKAKRETCESANGEPFTGEVWGIANRGSNMLIPSIDDDGSSLMYFSEKTAKAAARRSNKMYRTDAIPVRIV